MDPRSQEAADALRVDEAMRRLRSDEDETAEAALLDVVRRAPERYQWQTEEGGKRCCRFWDEAEFLHFVTFKSPDGECAWLKSAYPRAFYYLGFLRTKQGRFDEALAFLDAGMAMEPENPNFICEKGHVLARLGRHQESLALYSTIREPTPRVSARQVAAALRGQGVALIDLGRLDEAEAALHRSLERDPTSEVALGELQYIADLRAGQAPVETLGTTTATPQLLNRCIKCGAVAKSGRVGNVDGHLVFLCRACAPPASRWWQFWK